MQFGMISDPTVTSTTVPECHFRRIVLKDSESLYKSLQGDVCEQASAVQRQEYRSPDSPQQEKSAWQARWNWNNQMADCFWMLLEFCFRLFTILASGNQTRQWKTSPFIDYVPWVSMVFPQFFLSWGPNQPHVQRQEGRDVLPAAVGHEASGASDIVMYKMSHTPIYIYIVYIVRI